VALEPVGGAAQVLDRRAQVLLDLLVGGDAGGHARRSAAAQELLVDLTRGSEGALQVIAQVLVLQRPLDVGLGVGNSVFRVGHSGSPFSRCQAQVSYPCTSRA